MQKTLIHIGFHKTGTTFLQKYFEQHPKVYYDQAMFENYRKTGVVRKELYRTNIPDGLAYVLSEEEFTVWGGALNRVGVKFVDYGIKEHQLQVCKNLHSMFPNAKVLITIRKYETLIPSLYSQYLLNGGVLSFKNFLKSHKKTTDLMRLFDYEYIISIYKSFFGENKVCVLHYELLKDNPEQFLKVINTFVGLPSIEFSNDVVNRSIPEQKQDMIRLISNLVYFSVKFFPIKYQKKIYMNYVKFLFRLKNGKWNQLKRVSISPKKEKMILDFINDFNSKK